MPPQSHSRVLFYIFCVASLLAVTNSNSERGKFVAFNDISAPEEDLAYEAAQQLGQLIHRLNQLNFEEQSRQMQLPNITINSLLNRIPCSCDKGICKCCAGLLSVIGMNSCTEVVYRPEEFSFELKMRVNDNVWFRRKISGQNPPPVCFRPPRFGFVRACMQFHDIWFSGRNMHVCMHMSAAFQGYELFERNFDCLKFGDEGVKVVKAEEGFPIRPGDVEIDDSYEEIEEYDENVIRKKRKVIKRMNGKLQREMQKKSALR